jgi:hypothetical protein
MDGLLTRRLTAGSISLHDFNKNGRACPGHFAWVGAQNKGKRARDPLSWSHSHARSNSTRRDRAFIAAGAPVAEPSVIVVPVPFRTSRDPAVALSAGGNLSKRRKPAALLRCPDLAFVRVPIVRKTGRSGAHEDSDAEGHLDCLEHVGSPLLLDWFVDTR